MLLSKILLIVIIIVTAASIPLMERGIIAYIHIYSNIFYSIVITTAIYAIVKFIKFMKGKSTKQENINNHATQNEKLNPEEMPKRVQGNRKCPKCGSEIFTGYKQMVMELVGDLKILKEYSEHLNLSGNVESISNALKKLAEDSFDIAIIGEFNRGKSTLINALIGRDVLPMDVLPTTATLNRITYNIAPFVHVKFKDGHEEDLDIENLKSYVTKLTDESSEMAKTIDEVIVNYPINYCKNNVDIIDTPGLNDESAMTEVTMSVLPKVDAALMVIMAQSPFSESERSFLESKVITSDLGRILFVVTGIDLLDEEDVDRVSNNIASSIQKNILAKAAKTMGENSKELEAYKRKIGKVRVFGLSAKKALKAKMAGNDEALKKSCFPEFENELERFLTEDRGAIMLSVPVSRALSASVEILKSISLHENALLMQKEEFNKKYSLAMEEIEEIRNQRREEFNRINKSARETFDELKPLIKGFWPKIEAKAEEAIERYFLINDDINNENIELTQIAIMDSIKKETSETAQILSEQIQNCITTALEEETDKISVFENSFLEATAKIQDLFFIAKPVQENSGTALGTTLNYFTLGGGSAYLGFKEAGWKGALIGGLSGGAATFGGAFATGLVFTALGLSFTFPVLLIVGIGSALLGTFTGKKATSMLFPQDKTERFKSEFKKEISAQFVEMKTAENFSEKVRTQVDTAFTALKDSIQRETENILNDTQNTLTQLKVDLANNTTTTEKEQEQLKKMIVGTEKIISHAESVNSQLTAVMSRR